MMSAKSLMVLLYMTINVQAFRAPLAARPCHVGSSGDDLVDLVTTPEEDCVCGERNTVHHNYVSKGKKVEENEFPWQVLVETYFDSSPTHRHTQLCGGTLLDSITVLSAAHCFYSTTTGARANALRVTLGDHDRRNYTGPEIYDGVLMTSVILHPGYSTSRGDNDISMIFLSFPVLWTDHPKIRPACLPSEGSTKEKHVGRYAVATGWGKEEFDAPKLVNVLQGVKVKVKKQQTCKDRYKDHRLGLIINDGMLCGGEGGNDTCQGDSGGPLVLRDPNGQYEVIGVTKGGKGCGDIGFPGLYTSTVHYRAWIQQQRAAWVQPDYEEYEYEEEEEESSGSSSGQEGGGEEVTEPSISDEPSALVFKTSYVDNLWTDAVIPYRFEMFERNGVMEPIFLDSQISKITEAIRNVSENVPCLQFRPVGENYTGPHVIITIMMFDIWDDNPPHGCWSYFGMVGPVGGHRGIEALNYGAAECLHMANIYHEMLHSLGATHEVSRSDRLENIKINQNNILPNKLNSFTIKTDEQPRKPYSTEYDFLSITHWDRKAFSRNGADAWTPLTTTANSYGMEPNQFLSLTDIIEMGLAYSRVTDRNCFKKEHLLEFLANEKTPPEVTRFLKTKIPDMSEEDSKAMHGGHRACCMRCWWHPQKKRCVSFNMGKTCPC